MKVKIFYSWQSDLPNNCNRGFIERSIEKALKRIKGRTEDLALEPCIDRDTKDMPGSPEIAQTIFDKIRAAQIFIADVSVINKKSLMQKLFDHRATANPNVLLELGYAVGCLGWDRIICVYNLAYGGEKQLPFDLRGRRISFYSKYKNSGNSNTEEYSKDLAAKIDSILSTIDQSKEEVSKDVVLSRGICLMLSAHLPFLQAYVSSSYTNETWAECIKRILPVRKAEFSEVGCNEAIEELLKAFSVSAPFAASGIFRVTSEGVKVPLPHMVSLIKMVVEINSESNALLSKYGSACSSQLIKKVELLQHQCRGLETMMAAAFRIPGINETFKNGINNEQHLDFWRGFLKSVAALNRISIE